MPSMDLRRLATAGAIGLALAAAPAGVPAAQAEPDAGELLYVCIQDEARIAVVDMDATRVVRTIDLRALGFSATAKPHHIAVDPAGEHWYVSLIGANRVLKLDRADRLVAQYEMEVPGMLSLSPGGDVLAVSRSMSAVNPPARIALLSTATMEGEELEVLFPRPHPVVVAPNGFAYTGSLGVNQLASVSLADGRVEIVPLAGPPHSLVQYAISPDGGTLVGSTDRSGQLLVLDLAEPSRPLLVASVEVGAMAFDPAFTPDGRFVYVPVKGADDIAVVQTDGWTVTRRIAHEALRQPHQIVFSQDGARAFVTNNNKADHMADPAMADHDMHASPEGDGPASLVVIDVTSGRVVEAIELGLNLTGMGARAPR